MKASIVNDIISKINEHMPPALKDCGEEFERSFRSVLESVLSKLDLITREEFDIQCELLARTREKVDTLEEQVAELINKSAPKKK